jgi:hypothetical protein
MGWISLSLLAHAIFTLVDAPKPEVLGQMAMELHLMDWNTSIVHSVMPMQEAMSLVQQQKKGHTL